MNTWHYFGEVSWGVVFVIKEEGQEDGGQLAQLATLFKLVPAKGCGFLSVLRLGPGSLWVAGGVGQLGCVVGCRMMKPKHEGVLGSSC